MSPSSSSGRRPSYPAGYHDRLRLTLTFQKPDEGAYAAATLKRVSLSDGAVTSIASVNTGSHIPGPAIQAADRTISCAAACFESSVYAYYVEVVLWKAAAASQPRVLGLKKCTSVDRRGTRAGHGPGAPPGA